jgi:hypothetical protein
MPPAAMLGGFIRYERLERAGYRLTGRENGSGVESATQDLETKGVHIRQGKIEHPHIEQSRAQRRLHKAAHQVRRLFGSQEQESGSVSGQYLYQCSKPDGLRQIRAARNPRPKAKHPNPLKIRVDCLRSQSVARKFILLRP